MELTLALEKQLLEKEKELLLEHQKKFDELVEHHENRLMIALSNQATQLTNATKGEVEKNEILIRKQLNDEFTHQLALLRQEQVKTLLEAQEAVISQSAQIVGIRSLISSEFGKTTVSANVHALSAAVLLIETALLSGSPVDREISSLKKHSEGY